ncbi:MAG TPA: hypothetical protein VGQ99_13725 [Tepidisphaeraceae bacterium]|jgi:hypothetical protein|nr:hypothetical protein [Tepidisphaeraceae bacterium]
MMEFSGGISLIAIILPIGLLVLGFALIKIGFWPRRKGKMPHCPECGYALVGNQSGTCPECGRPWTEATTVRGERHRSNGIGFAGVAVALLGLSIGGGVWLTDINWYHYLPVSLIVGDAGSSDPTVARQAWNELARRRAIAPLPDSVETKLTEIALKEQASASPGPMLDAMLEFVGQRFLDKKLTEQQADRFFLDSVNLSVHTRSMVSAGDVVPVQVRTRGRGPSAGWSYRLTLKKLKIGERTIQMGSSMGGSGIGGAGSFTTYENGQPAGQYPVEAQALVEIFHAPNTGTAAPLWSRELTLKTTLKVVSQSPDDMVSLADRPQLAEQIRRSIKIERFTRQPDGSYEMSIHIEKPPIDAAFSVFARAAGKEFRLGDIAVDTKTTMTSFLHPSNIGEIPPGKVVVILRSDAGIARKTIELVEIWKGEIVLDDVELTEQKK